MENNNKKKRKELQVSAIENGTVIDHVKFDSVMQVVKILDLQKIDDPVYIGSNLISKKYTKKGIIKVSNKFFEPDEINKIALVSPTATLIEIRDYEITRKGKVEIPDKINGIVKCVNPNCITNVEDVSTKFTVIDKDDIKLRCHYCEKITAKRNMEFK